MNKTTSVMHFFNSEKDIEKDRLRETGFNNDLKAKTYTNLTSERSSSQKDFNKVIKEQVISDVKMPNIFSTKENLGDNKLFESSQKIFRNKFGIVPDVEKIKDELMKLKQEFNKKTKELSVLKKDYFKLQDEHNNTLKVFEDILNDPKTNPEIFNLYGNDNKDGKEVKEGNEKEELSDGDEVKEAKVKSNDANLISNTSFVKLREVTLI